MHIRGEELRRGSLRGRALRAQRKTPAERSCRRKGGAINRSLQSRFYRERHSAIDCQPDRRKNDKQEHHRGDDQYGAFFAPGTSGLSLCVHVLVLRI
jgi:hypothetical protein